MSDPFGLARSAFTEMDDFEGRLLLVVPLSTERRQSTLPNSNGKMVDVVIADIIVIDGELNDRFDTLPYVEDKFMIWSQTVCGQVRGKLGKKNADGSPAMTLGRLAKVPAPNYGKDSKSWKLLSELTEADLTKARKAAADYIAATVSDPFATA